MKPLRVSLFCCNCEINTCQLSRITPVDSQVLIVYHGNEPVNITLDSRATASFITLSFCKKLQLDILPNGQMARLGDGCTTMASLGEVDVILTRNKWSLRFQAIVVEKLNSEVYGGMNFLKENDIQTRPSTGEIKVHNKFTVYQTNTLMSPPQLKSIENSSPSILTIVLPKRIFFPPIIPFDNDPLEEEEVKSKNDYTINAVLPIEFKDAKLVVVEPRNENKIKTWPSTQIMPVKEGIVSLENTTENPINIPRDVHLINVKLAHEIPGEEIIKEGALLSNANSKVVNETDMNKKAIENASNIDLSRAPPQLQTRLKQAHLQYADVFAPDLTIGYNGNSG